MKQNIKEFESLKNYCSYKTGGVARYLATPETIQELKELIIWADALRMPHEIIGLGANLLFSDDGYNGLIISLRRFEKWCINKGSTIIAGAGTPLNDVVIHACRNRLKGIENLAWIPGSVGGAIKMNAGAFGTEMKDIVSRISILTAQGDPQNITLKESIIYAGEAEFGYRESRGLLGKIVLAVEMELMPSDEDLNAVADEVKLKRKSKQPLEYPSCGSVFKRPVNNYAGALIESCGLKGYAIGGAQVSEKHANFIVNTGDATSTDIYSLIKHIQKTVLLEKKILLQEEVKYIGNFEIPDFLKN